MLLRSTYYAVYRMSPPNSRWMWDSLFVKQRGYPTSPANLFIILYALAENSSVPFFIGPFQTLELLLSPIKQSIDILYFFLLFTQYNSKYLIDVSALDLTPMHHHCSSFYSSIICNTSPIKFTFTQSYQWQRPPWNEMPFWAFFGFENHRCSCSSSTTA